MKLGIFGGTFDPPHHGHLIAARAAAEVAGLDRILIVPAALNPFKAHRASAPGDVRLRMIEAAVAGDPLFEPDGRELRRPPPSFTIDTVHEIAAEHPHAALHLLLGGDNRPQIEGWHRIAELRSLVRFIWLDRPGSSPARPAPGEIAVPMRLDISSTDIRNRVATARPIRYLLPDSVIAIIDSLQLYKDPHVRQSGEQNSRP